MRSLVVTAVVTPEHTVTVTVPGDIAPGPHQVVLVIQEDVQPLPQGQPDFLNWPAHPVALVDPSFTFRREDLYGDDGR
ncbi:MAG TPA: hypothetical protein VKA46_08570 [Gemmataceae bacterium]|nr:hypothetical protein [Gemmataceae bacterium]